ncbi:MAG: hypothetical protein CYPHOPRED_000246 [Cyphobasidiales sp. Tagirdzhanova-0007]|nr:MAG: hypothetical protein CYPHOPRED_000246 [Cyphobasidiales sp. Tagirdzhanova-0007]
MADSKAQSSGLPVEITMLYFASARTALDKSSERISLPASLAVSQLSDALLKKYNNLRELRTILQKSAFSVNEEIVYRPEDTILKHGDVVAIIPPVSGG